MKKAIALLLGCLFLSGCGLSQLSGGFHTSAGYIAPPDENSMVANLGNRDTWANYYSMDYVFKTGDSTFEIDVYRKGKKVAEGYGEKKEAKKIIDFLSDWIDEK